MSSPRFKEAIFNDTQQIITLEGAIKTCGIFAGCHDYSFQNALDEDFESGLGSWTTDVLATWDGSPSTLDATGGGSAIWYEARHATEVPPSFVASFDVVSGSGAFVFHGKTSASTADCYIAFWTGSTCGFARVAADKSATYLTVMPYGISMPSRIQVGVLWRLDSVDGDRKWLVMSLYVDGREWVSYADDIGSTAYDWANDYVGFAVTGSNNCVFDNLTVQELTRIVDYISIDPNETARHGISRAIGTSRVALKCRYDGTIEAWRPGNRASDWTIPDSRPVQIADKSRVTDTVTHVRTLGVMHSVDRFDTSEGEAHMHRFLSTDDPNLMSESEVYTEAGYLLNEAKEEQEPKRITMPGQPLIEAQDVITYDGVDYRVLGIHTNYRKEQAGVSYETVLDVRRYYAT